MSLSLSASSPKIQNFFQVLENKMYVETGPRKTNPEENVRLLRFIINVQKITKCYALATMANTGHTAQSFYMIISLEKLCHELGEHLRIIFFPLPEDVHLV